MRALPRMPVSSHTYRNTLLFILPFLLVLFFFNWVFRVVLPVAGVEIRYQYQRLLTDLFHTSDWRGIILPQFRFIIDPVLSSHRDAGINIPKLFLDESVVYNVDPNDKAAYTKALGKGIAHASSTSLPDSGGLGYYFAHSSTPENVRQFNAVFYLLGKLIAGDEIYLWHEGKPYSYRVTGVEITTPADVAFLSRPFETETIVLQTCWPPGTTLKRLLVFASRTASP